MTTSRISTSYKQLRVNGTDIHYRDGGDGPPLVVLHGGLMSTDALWDGHPASLTSHLETLASRFRVIAPDIRGYGRTPNPGGGPISYAQLTDDVVAFAAALGLDRPLVYGFSEGATIANVAAIRVPDAFRAVVNHAGFDMLDPQSRVFPMGRHVFGGSPDATKPAPESFEGFATAQGGPMAELARRIKLDHKAQGADGWKTALAMAFERMTVPSSITLEDLRKVTAPTMIVVGDRDMFCSVEEAVAAYRLLGTGELAIVPGVGHEISAAVIDLTIDFLQRHR
jgi:pimeloyl-ACP methyl ester carboxylesterase